MNIHTTKHPNKFISSHLCASCHGTLVAFFGKERDSYDVRCTDDTCKRDGFVSKKRLEERIVQQSQDAKDVAILYPDLYPELQKDTDKTDAERLTDILGE